MLNLNGKTKDEESDERMGEWEDSRGDLSREKGQERENLRDLLAKAAKRF